MSWPRRLLSDDRGLETVEYAIIGGLIVAVVAVAVAALSTWMGTSWTALRNDLLGSGSA